MRYPVLWCLVGLIVAKNVVHFRQATEFGVEQLQQDAGTDRITFFAAIRQTLDDLDVEYVLSFGPPKCELSCAQSVSNICKDSQQLVNPEWEHIQIEHYPEPTDPAAIYIRRTIALGSDLACTEGDLVKGDTLNGSLYLSVALDCDEATQCPVFETVEVYPFSISSIDDLKYHTASYVFDAKATRNLRMENVGLFVEISTEIFNQTNANFTNPRIVSQTCEPKLRIVAMTDCQPDMPTCKQEIYLSPVDSKDSSIEKVEGALTLELELGTENSRVLSLLHLNVGIESSNDYGVEERVVDTLFSIFTDEYNAYFARSNMTVIDKDQFCVSLASPTLHPVDIDIVQTCSMNGTICRVLFNSSIDVERELTSDSQSMACVTMPKIVDGSQTVEIGYHRTEKRRGAYGSDTVMPTIIYCDCPLGYVWDPLCDCCVNSHHDWDWSWGWIWIVALIVAGVVLLYCVVASTGCYSSTVSQGVPPSKAMQPDKKLNARWRE